jgi:hypothetical protein
MAVRNAFDCSIPKRSTDMAIDLPRWPSGSDESLNVHKYTEYRNDLYRQLPACRPMHDQLQVE